MGAEQTTPNLTPAQSQTAKLLADSIPQEIHNSLLESTQSLAHKHVTVSYLLLGILGFVLLLGGLGAYFAAKWVDRALARAEQSEELYKADKLVSDKAIADLKTQLATSEAARAASDARVMEMQKQIAIINANASKEREQILKPGKTASEAYADLAHEYKLTTPLNIQESPDKTEQLLIFRIPDVQQFSIAKVDLGAAQATVVIKDQQLKEKDGQIDGLKKDLVTSQGALAALQTTEKQEHDALEKYKSVAKKSKFKKILSGFYHGAETAIVAVAAFELGKKF